MENAAPNSLAKIPLRWMIRETFRCKTGILWNTERFEEIGLRAQSLYPEIPEMIHLPFEEDPPAPEHPNQNAPKPNADLDDPDYLDAISPMFDRLASQPLWRMLETLNRGQGRSIPPGKMYIHKSVRLRMKSDPSYKWKAVGSEGVGRFWVD